jgi:hypothetical protein
MCGLGQVIQSACSFQNEKQTEKGLGEFISLVGRFEQLGSISTIMTSFSSQDFGSSFSAFHF